LTNLNKTDINDKVKTDIIERSGFLKDCLKRVCAAFISGLPSSRRKN